ncbi:MAG TPA: Hsp20/alpha crystallin family protein [Candidatus Binatia bacterium]|nr:Hsp20/alpha crystallin family protein [Candidatus Binatia bacterium]
MELVKWQPFNGVDRLFHAQMNELFADVFGGTHRTSPLQNDLWYPKVDIAESKDEYLIKAEVPGMKKEDFSLEVKDNVLTLSGERKAEQAVDGVEYRRVERVAGKFVRSFTLPELVKHDAIKANYQDGVLEIHVPKAEAAKPKRIEISIH